MIELPTHIDLFAGVGGFSLAAQWAGFRTLLHVEIDPFCQSVLKKHWPEVPVHDDIKTLDATLYHGRVDLLTGGFPCQPFSIAGKRQGAKDDRHLWPEMRRVVAEVRPTWVVGENVGHFVNMALDDVLDDLDREDYEAWSFVFPAAAVGAPHRRYRTLVVAHANSIGQHEQPQCIPEVGHGTGDGCPNVADASIERRGSWGPGGSDPSGARQSKQSLQDVADANEQRLQGHGRRDKERDGAGEWIAWKGSRPFQAIWESEPRVCGMADGLPPELDPYQGRLVQRKPGSPPGRAPRLRALGNAVVPQQVFPILRAIATIERDEDRHGSD